MERDNADDGVIKKSKSKSKSKKFVEEKKEKRSTKEIIRSTLKLIFLTPLDRGFYVGTEKHSRLWQNRFLWDTIPDVFWVLHGKRLWGRQKTTLPFTKHGYFDVLTFGMFRLAIWMIQESRSVLKFRWSDIKAINSEPEYIFLKMAALPALGLGYLLHLVGNYFLRPLFCAVVTVLVTFAIPIAPIVFFLANRHADRMAAKTVNDYDVLYEDNFRKDLRRDSSRVSRVKKTSARLMQKLRGKDKELEVEKTETIEKSEKSEKTEKSEKSEKSEKLEKTAAEYIPLKKALQEKRVNFRKCVGERADVDGREEYQLMKPSRQIVASFAVTKSTESAIKLLEQGLLVASREQRKKMFAKDKVTPKVEPEPTTTSLRRK